MKHINILTKLNPNSVDFISKKVAKLNGAVRLMVLSTLLSACAGDKPIILDSNNDMSLIDRGVNVADLGETVDMGADLGMFSMEPDMNPDAGTDMEPDMNPDAGTDMEPDMNPDAGTDMEPDMNPDAGTDIEPDMNPDAGTDMEPDMNPDAGTDMDPDAETDMEIDMEPTEDMTPMMPADSDNDGVTNDIDQCANTPAGADVDDNGCADSQLDSDNDNVTNDVDQCANTPAGADVDDNGCADSQLDTDNDGVTNDIDQCDTLPGGDVDTVGCCVTVLSDEIDSELPENPIQVNSNGSFVLSSRMFFDAPLISPIFELGTWNGMVVTENQTDLIFTFLNQDTDNRNDSFIGFAYDDSNNSLNVYRTNRSSLMNHHLTGVTFYAFSGPIVENLQYDPTPGSTGLTRVGCGEVSHETFQKVERLMNRMFPSE